MGKSPGRLGETSVSVVGVKDVGGSLKVMHVRCSPLPLSSRQREEGGANSDI